MSLYALQVTSSDITALQQGILFTTTSATDINNKVSAINGGTLTVDSYANQLLGSVLNTAQMAMGVSALETNSSQSVATLTNLVTNPGIIPAYVNFAKAQGIDAGQVVGENIGLVFSGDPTFDANYGSLSLSAFSAKAGAVTGINPGALATQAQFFLNLYDANGLPGNPNPTPAQITDAAYGVAFGLGVALAIEGVGTQATTIQGQVKNALFDIAQTSSSPPGQMYVPGATLAAQPGPTPFQSGGPPPPSNPLTIVDIIPRSESSFDTFSNNEPDIAVNPRNPLQMVASVFGFSLTGGDNPPYFASTDGGTTWSLFGSLPHGDTTEAWSLDGSKVLAATLTNNTVNPDMGSTINTFSSTVANGTFGTPIDVFSIGTKGLDQPWIETGPNNKVYEAYNNISLPAGTASIRVSPDGGNTYGPPILLDRAGGAPGDDPAVREAVNQNTVYAVFDRNVTQVSRDANGTLFDSQIVVVKSVDGGADGFTALGADGNGVVVSPPGTMTGITNVGNTLLSVGANRAGAGSAIAVNPSNANDVVAAYSKVTDFKAGVIQVVVQESLDGGTTWNQKFISPGATQSGQTQLAILNNGAIGVLYNSFDLNTKMLSVHLVTTTNDFATTTDTTLATQTNPPGNPTPGGPYLGDYNGLVAVGNSFEGVFAALNEDNGATATIAPNNNPASVVFQRAFTGTPGTNSFQITDGTPAAVPVPNSIDPYFFKFTPPAAAPLVGVAQTPLDHAQV